MSIARGMNALLRVVWAFFGLVLSVPAFLPPLAGAIAVVAIGGLSGDSPSQMLHSILLLPQRSALLFTTVLYAVYWACVGVLVVQFVLKKELWMVPLAVVAVGMASALVALQPWHRSSEPFTVGPFAMLHVVFMLTIFWAGARQPAGAARRDAG